MSVRDPNRTGAKLTFGKNLVKNDYCNLPLVRSRIFLPLNVLARYITKFEGYSQTADGKYPPGPTSVGGVRLPGYGDQKPGNYNSYGFLL